MHEGLHLGKGQSGLEHEDYRPAAAEHKWQKSEEPSGTTPVPGTSTQPYEEFLSRGLHHITMLLGSHPLTPEPSAPVLIQAIKQAAIEGQHIPLDQPPVAAIAQPTTNTQTVRRTVVGSNGSLGGGHMPVFNGNRSKAKSWMCCFKVYMMANKGKDQIVVPEQCVGVALSYIMGPHMDAWVDEQLISLEDKVAGRADPKDENLWKVFEKAFDVAFTNQVDQQWAHQQLINLKMSGGDLDTYTADFNCLAKVAGFKDSEKGTMELYKQGLNNQLLNAIINNYTKWPETLEEWQKEAHKWQVHWLEAKNSGQGLTPKQMQWATVLKLKNYTLPSQRTHNQVVSMDVDATRFQELSPEEQEQLHKTRSCFFCKKKGHIAQDCYKKKAANGGGWSGVTRRSQGQGPTQKQTGGQKACVTEVKDDDATVVPDLKSLSKEEIKELLLELLENDCTTILDSVVDF
jgi:hypothetical protein